MPDNIFLSFTLGGVVYGFDIRFVKETFFIERYTPTPEVADHIIGLCSLHEEIVTLFDLRKRFGLPAEEGLEAGQCIALKTAAEMVEEGILPAEGEQLTIHSDGVAPVDRVGIIVHDLGEVITADESSVGLQPPSLKGVGKKYLEKLVALDDEMMLVLDITATFAQERLRPTL